MMLKLEAIHLLKSVLPYWLSRSCQCAGAAVCIFIQGTTTFPYILRSSRPEAFFKTAVLKHSQILRKPSVAKCFCSLKLKKNISQRTISSEISQIFQGSFSKTFGRLLPWNKKPSRSSRQKEFLEIAVLKYLRELPLNYPS